MLVDAHFHALDLEERDPLWLEGFRALALAGAASCHSTREFLHAEALRRAGERILVCFGVHPQSPVADEEGAIAEMAMAGRIDAIGECGFDLYDPGYRAAESEQEKRFAFQTALARERSLPLVIHSRNSLDRLFARSAELKRLRAVVFHAFPGSAAEGAAFLKRGVNAFFSFGTSAMNGRRRSAQAAAALPSDRILLETDAPYMPPRRALRPAGSPGHCRPQDLSLVYESIAALRGVAVEDIERSAMAAFAAAFGSLP
jgi:TatD DNase family protein